MGYSARVLADSISPAGHRLSTFEVCFPRIVLAEFNTHRVFSRNPAKWPKNQKGMQASEELDELTAMRATKYWLGEAWAAVNCTKVLAEELDVHKQIANRLLEPWLWHTVIVSATEWSNFFNLRDNKKAQPEIQKAADLMHQLYLGDKPRELKCGEWHLPLVTKDEIINTAMRPMSEWVKISCARCARVSYLTHDGKRDPQEDLRLYGDLVQPGHMSPLEHAARPMTREELDLFYQEEVFWDEKDQAWKHTGKEVYFLGNYNGWIQHRKMIPGESDILGYRREQ
jgi:hypothetical protein